MTETIDTFCDVEEAIADLEAMNDDRRPNALILSEIERLRARLRHIERSEPVFVQRA